MTKPKNAPAVPKEGPPYKCPECSREFQTPTARGTHRRSAHGIAGTSAGTIKYHEQRAAALAAKEHHNEGLVHQAKATPTEAESKPAARPIGRPKTTTPTSAEVDQAVEIATAVAVGRIQELLQSLAYQHDVPPRTFTARVLRSVAYAAALR